MEQFSQNSIEYGKWVSSKYDSTQIFKCGPGISVSAKSIPKKTSFTINLMGKDLEENYKDIETAKTAALIALKNQLEKALNNIKDAQSTII